MKLRTRYIIGIIKTTKCIFFHSTSRFLPEINSTDLTRQNYTFGMYNNFFVESVHHSFLETLVTIYVTNDKKGQIMF